MFPSIHLTVVDVLCQCFLIVQHNLVSGLVLQDCGSQGNTRRRETIVDRLYASSSATTNVLRIFTVRKTYHRSTKYTFGTLDTYRVQLLHSSRALLGLDSLQVVQIEHKSLGGSKVTVSPVQSLHSLHACGYSCRTARSPNSTCSVLVVAQDGTRAVRSWYLTWRWSVRSRVSATSLGPSQIPRPYLFA